MAWVYRMFALVLLALWVPATSHCAVDALLNADSSHHSASSCSCSHDGAGTDTDRHPVPDACATIEEGSFKSVSETLVAPAPELSVLLCLRCAQAAVQAEAAPLALAAGTGEHPCEWVPVRVFVQRAALPARAPTRLN